jgi:hypothetical protein
MKKLKVYLDSDGIMRVEHPIHANITIYHLQEEYEKRIAITSRKTPLLVKIHGVASFSEEAQTFLCGADHSAITSAVAIVSNPKAGFSEHSKILMGSFKSRFKPPFDIRVFEDEEPAITWLKSQLR